MTQKKTKFVAIGGILIIIIAVLNCVLQEV